MAPAIQEQLFRRLLWAVTAVMLVAGVLSAAIVGADDGSDGLATSSSASTTTAPLAGGGSAGAGDAGSAPPPGPPAQGSGPATTPGASPSPATTPGSGSSPGGTEPQPQPGDFRDLGSVDDAGATSVPAAGTYPYRFMDDSGEARDASRTVEDKGATATGTRRLVMTYRGEGIDLIDDALWGPDDVRYTKTTFVFGETRAECDWEPDYVARHLVLARGRTWEAKSSCTMQAGPTAAIVRRTTTAKVTDARRVRVAGSEILTWVIESDDRLEIPGQGTFVTKETTWFAPRLGLPVRQLGETTSGDPGDGSTKSEIVITRLTPS